MRKGITFLCWLVALGWICAVIYLSLLPAQEVPRVVTFVPDYADYIEHGAAYFLLAFLLFVAWQRTLHSSFATAFAVIIGWCLVFGLGMEFAQKYLTTTRQFSLSDLLADGVGAALLLAALLILRSTGKTGRQFYCFLAGHRVQ